MYKHKLIIEPQLLVLERLALERLAFWGEWEIIFLSTLLGKVGEGAGKGILEYFLLFGFGMEGISLISESGLLLPCKILDPNSVVLCSILSLEIIPEGLSWGCYCYSTPTIGMNC